MSRNASDRRRAVKAGFDAEKLVASHLEEQEFTVLAERYKTKFGEVDLIAERDLLVVFLEVKARKSVEEGLYSITAKARKRIASSASQWIAENGYGADETKSFRFDVAIVTPDQEITLIESAFDDER